LKREGEDAYNDGVSLFQILNSVPSIQGWAAHISTEKEQLKRSMAEQSIHFKQFDTFLVNCLGLQSFTREGRGGVNFEKSA